MIISIEMTCKKEIEYFMHMLNLIMQRIVSNLKLLQVTIIRFKLLLTYLGTILKTEKSFSSCLCCYKAYEQKY